MKEVHVAAGVIFNSTGLVLICQRSGRSDFAGYWEFPGGKVESDETNQQALVRELQEEVGLEIQQASAWFSVRHRYSHKLVVLHIFLVDKFRGKAMGREGQEVRWVAIESLSNYTFPEANMCILSAIKQYSVELPHH